MNWAVEVQQTALERRNLADLLAGLGFLLIDGEQQPLFTSQELDQCETASEALHIAKKVRAAFSGPAGIDPEFTLGAVIECTPSPPRRHRFLEVEPGSCVILGGRATLSVCPPADLSPEDLHNWQMKRAEDQYQSKLEAQRAKLEPAYTEPRAAKVIEYMSIFNPSAEILYKIYELVEEHPSKRGAFHDRFGISRADFDRFQDSVHNPTVSGDWARHAYHKTPKTQNPMSRTEAESFVRRIAEEWLRLIRTSSIR